jgi:hypothetical protein
LRVLKSKLPFFILALWASVWSTSAKNAPQGKALDSIGDGRRLSLKEGDLSIVTPVGWDVQTSAPGLTLLLQSPNDSRARYRRAIQIASFNGPRYMDSLTAQEFEGIIARKFSAISPAVKNYQIRNHANIEMDDGRPALLFYAEFRLDDVELMQAHILVSTTKRHYLLTYTDLASHFEGSSSGPYLNEAWQIMKSTLFRAESPKRFHATLWMTVAIGFIVTLLGFFWSMRRRRSGTRLVEDVAQSYSETGKPLVPEGEIVVWTLPEPRKLGAQRKKATSDLFGADDDLLPDDEAS